MPPTSACTGLSGRQRATHTAAARYASVRCTSSIDAGKLSDQLLLMLVQARRAVREATTPSSRRENLRRSATGRRTAAAEKPMTAIHPHAVGARLPCQAL